MNQVMTLPVQAPRSVPPPVAEAPKPTLVQAPPTTRTAARTWAGVLGPLAAVAMAIGIWVASLPQIHTEKMTDLGLISALPAGVFLAIAIITASFCATLWTGRLREPLLLLHVAALVVILYGTPALVEAVPRFAVTWRHTGITDYVLTHHGVNPEIDAYFNWPGFFFLLGILVKATGVHSAISFGSWAPVFFEALYLAPLLAILTALTSNRRLVWLAVWLFYATNWIGQDYMSPQASVYFMYLVILAILVRWFPRELPGTEQVSGLRRAGLMFAAIAIFAAIVPSHQLTPFVVLISVGALVLFRRSSARGLPTLMIVLTGAWISFMTVAYLRGHVTQLAGNVGDVHQSVGANVSGRVKGSSEHLMVVYVRLALTAGLWGLAGLGLLRRLRAGKRDWTCVILAGAPFALLPMQPYGGEILLRIFLFSLPFTAFLAGSLALPTARSGRTPWMAIAAGLASCVLIGAFLVARYGNERMDAFSKKEITAIERLYDVAPHGSVLFAGGPNTPWKFAHYTDYKYRILTSTDVWRTIDPTTAAPSYMAKTLANEMGKGGKPAYIVFTRREAAGIEILGIGAHGSMERFERAVGASRDFQLVYANNDARIFKLRPSVLQEKKRS
jgi:hypothetical protein